MLPDDKYRMTLYSTLLRMQRRLAAVFYTP